MASDEKLSEAKAKLSEASEVLREGAKELLIAKRIEQEDKIVTTTETRLIYYYVTANLG